MANEKVSPEERLFKVIQEGKKSPSGIEVSKKKKIKIDLRGIKQFFTNLKPRPVAKEKPKEAGAPLALPIKLQEIDPKAINKVLIVILSLLTVLVIHSAINKRPNIAKITDAVSKIKFQALKKKAIESFKPVALYLEEVRKRDIFRPVPQAQQKVAIIAPKAKKAQAKLKEMAKDLKLVGISWGKSPKAMIRSQKEQNTYFLRQGQMIGTTGIEVKTIFKDKVIISYQGEEMELL
jgi:type II secretory pathway component PulC